MKITISQGTQPLPYAHINIVIDVIRAFSVSHYAFQHGINEIILVKEAEDALLLKASDPTLLLSGEIKGYKIDGFDFGNSPHELSISNLTQKTLVQRTTNGVKAALCSLDADHVLATGFVGAYETSAWVKTLVKNSHDHDILINIIASHPEGDDDLACAEYIQKILLDQYDDLSSLQEQTALRIIHSEAAKKFLDPSNQDFPVLDLIKCLSTSENHFIMPIIHNGHHVKILKRQIHE